MLKTTLMVMLALSGFEVMAQSEKGILSGKILDYKNQEPIPFVHVKGSISQTITNSNGHFSIQMLKGDTLTFSHLNYQRYNIQINSLPDYDILIHLDPKENIMDEVIINEYLPEEELKQEMIDHEVNYSTEEINAVQNVSQSTMLYKMGYVPHMNSLDNFKDYIKGPQGVTLFSSDPSKGLIKSLKNINKINYSLKNLNRVKTDSSKLNPMLQFVD